MKVCINGYGTIGKRVAEAVEKHPKLKLVGVSKYTPDQDAKLAIVSGKEVFVPQESIAVFESKGISVTGSVSDMIDSADVVIDASSDGKGVKNKADVYQPRQKRAIFQGGEAADIGFSFNARSNFDAAKNQQYIRVVSCNTTGYCRTIKPLAERYKIKNIDAFLIRRGADLNDAKGSALNSVEWKAKSHHAADVKTVIDVPISSVAFKVPHTHSHINSLKITFDGAVPKKDDLYDIFRNDRIMLLNSATTSSQIIEVCRDLGMKRFDTFMPAMLMNTFMSDSNSIFLTFAVPQESIVVPENIDAIIAQSGLMSREQSMKATDDLLGIAKIKSELESVFA